MADAEQTIRLKVIRAEEFEGELPNIDPDTMICVDEETGRMVEGLRAVKVEDGLDPVQHVTIEFSRILNDE